MTPGQEGRAALLSQEPEREFRRLRQLGGCRAGGGAVKTESWQARTSTPVSLCRALGHTAQRGTLRGLGKQELGAEESPELTFSPVV